MINKRVAMAVYSIDDFSRHIALRALQCSESATKVELNIILFSLHAHSQQQLALRIQI
jgi:hypothetical protein